MDEKELFTKLNFIRKNIRQTIEEELHIKPRADGGLVIEWGEDRWEIRPNESGHLALYKVKE